MKLQPFRKIYIAEELNLARVQDNVGAAIKPIIDDPLLNRITIKATINTSDTMIPHELGRTPTGYLVISKDANADIWTMSLTRAQIVLRASAQVDATLLLF